jgi:hypothetical protein
VRAYGSAAIDIAVLDACSARMMRLSSLTFLVSRLEGDQKQLQLSGQQESLEFFAEDTAESLAQNVRDVFELPNDTKLVLYYEKLKHDPADPTEFKLISAQALVSKGRSYLESGDVSVLMVPLQDDKLELFFRAQVPAAAAPAPAAVAAAAAAAAASYSGFALTPAVASASRRDLRMSSSTGASVRHSKASVMRSKQRSFLQEAGWSALLVSHLALVARAMASRLSSPSRSTSSSSSLRTCSGTTEACITCSKTRCQATQVRKPAKYQLAGSCNRLRLWNEHSPNSILFCSVPQGQAVGLRPPDQEGADQVPCGPRTRGTGAQAVSVILAMQYNNLSVVLAEYWLSAIAKQLSADLLPCFGFTLDVLK